MELCNWSTVILLPTFWQRLKFLFSWKPEIMFCWGDDLYLIRGCKGWSCWSVGGVPTAIDTRNGITIPSQQICPIQETPAPSKRQRLWVLAETSFFQRIQTPAVMGAQQAVVFPKDVCG